MNVVIRDTLWLILQLLDEPVARDMVPFPKLD
jgi:hypothetical protein